MHDVGSFERFLRPDRLQPRDGEIGTGRATGANGVAQNLRGGEVDLHNAGGLEHDQACLLRRRLQQLRHIAPERIRIEKRQRRLESDDHDVGLALAADVRTGRPPDRCARHPFVHREPRAGRAPYAMQQRERYSNPDPLLDRKDDDGRGGRHDQQEFAERLPVNCNDLADTDNP